MLGYLLCLLLLAVLGVAMMAKPRFFREIAHCFTTEGGRPTDWYLTVTRISGGVFVLLATGALLTIGYYEPR